MQQEIDAAVLVEWQQVHAAIMSWFSFFHVPMTLNITTVYWYITNPPFPDLIFLKDPESSLGSFINKLVVKLRNEHQELSGKICKSNKVIKKSDNLKKNFETTSIGRAIIAAGNNNNDIRTSISSPLNKTKV